MTTIEYFISVNVIHTEHLLTGFVVVKGKVDTPCTHFTSYWRQQLQGSRAVAEIENPVRISEFI